MENREYRILKNTVRSLTDSTDVKILTRDLEVSISGRNGMRPAVEFKEVSSHNGIENFLKKFRSFFVSNGVREALFVHTLELPHLFMEFGGYSEHEDTLPSLKDCLHGNLYGDSETGVLIERVPLSWALGVLRNEEGVFENIEVFENPYDKKTVLMITPLKRNTYRLEYSEGKVKAFPVENF